MESAHQYYRHIHLEIVQLKKSRISKR